MVVSSTSRPNSPATPSAWVQTELASVDFGDERLDKRAAKLLEALANHPQSSLPQAMGSWADTKAAYRFLRNPKVTPEKILGPHRAATLSRLKSHPIILAVQDTTELNYTAPPHTSDLGTIGSSPTLRGMLVHTTMAFSPERVPLGILAQDTWVRPDTDFGQAEHRRERDIQDKESSKWLRSLAVTESLQKQHPDAVLLNIGDREADIYDLFQDATCRDCEVLVRASWDRRVQQDQDHLWAYLQAQPVAATLELSVPVRKTKQLRTATLEVRFAPVTIQPPCNRRAEGLDPISLYAVYVHEPHPPEGVEPLSWMLLTTLIVVCAEEALQIIEFYAVRWSIEIFHRILKSGCRIEKRQLQTAQRLRNALALDSLVAWRIQQLTLLGRQTPDLPCDVVLEEHEWKALYGYVHRTTTPPEKPPPLSEAIRLIARIGGFLARKSDKEPGPTVLWRGLQQLPTICWAWFAFGPGRAPP